MSSRRGEFAADLTRRDSLETELGLLKGLIETVQVAVLNPDASREAIHDALEGAVISVDTVKSLCFGPTPT